MRAHDLGKEGEAFALDFLFREGYKIVEKNYRAKCGEIDIVAEHKGVIVFLEVKTRQEDGWGAFEAVDKRKQHKMFRTAQQFLIEKYGTEDVTARFDVLAVYEAPDGMLKGELLPDAFSK
ncbi:MAG: YraN family protein [Candidatus Omnitrophica bacterium]|nr:YraN family protein [Candidatus Omnitrophota bacterium]